MDPIQLLHIFQESGGIVFHILSYVDELLIVAKHMECIKEIRFQLGQEFEMKDLMAAKNIMGWKS